MGDVIADEHELILRLDANVTLLNMLTNYQIPQMSVNFLIS
jgi:hypothetical protein